VEFAGGKLIGVKPAGVPTGTSMSVADIFYCVPARRKFLKSETTELGHYRLARPRTTRWRIPNANSCSRRPRRKFSTARPSKRPADRVYQIFGRQALDELSEIPSNEAPVRSAITEPPLEPDEQAATIRVSGFTSRPEVQRTNRNGIYIFVNRRLVRDRLLLHAISEAYRNIMPPGLFPFVLLFLDLPYQEVDVNVHPAKIEVRFRHPQFVHDFTRDALRHALSIARPIPGFPRRARCCSAKSGSRQRSFCCRRRWCCRIHYPSVTSGAAPGPPRAMIPAAFASSATMVEAAETYELSGAPDSPVAQRFGFDSGRRDEFSPAGVRSCRRRSELETSSGTRLATTAPGSLPSAGRDCQSEAARSGEQQFQSWR